jgi:hypothetical protein
MIQDAAMVVALIPGAAGDTGMAARIATARSARKRRKLHSRLIFLAPPPRDGEIRYHAVLRGFPGMSFPTYVDLSTARLVGKGNKRSVFEHPDFPDMLIKVVRPELMDEAGNLFRLPTQKRVYLKVKHRLGALLPLKRELAEFLVLAGRRSNQGIDWPIQRVWGFVNTSLGFGVVVEKLTAPTGELAPTLVRLLQEKRFLPGHRKALQHMVDELARLHISVGHLHMKNIVFVGDLGNGGRFVGVDGLGEKNLIPLADWSFRFNRHQIRRRSRTLFAHLDEILARQKPG